MDSVGAILARSANGRIPGAPRTLPEIRLTKRKIKCLEAVTLVREQRENGKQHLAYNARPFILCGIPLRRPPRDQLIHSRHSGKFFLQITGHLGFGLPFGQDRLIPIWVATLALQQKSRVVQFGSAAQMLEFFRLSRDGYHYRRIVQGFQRLFAATIFFGTEGQPDGNPLIDWARFHFFDPIQLWFNREIDEHRMPVEREVVAALAHAPGVLDFYLWIVWKSWSVKGQPARIPIFGNGGLNEQLGAKEYSLHRGFRHTVVSWLHKVKVFWPECPATISRRRRTPNRLVPSRSADCGEFL